MDSLPDGLLLRVLSHVADGPMLLDVLPLVCRRWQRLCWHPDAWAEVDVEWDGAEDDGSASDDSGDSAPLAAVDVERLLLRAPALRTLRVDWDWDWDGALPRVMAALRRSRVVVRESFQVGSEVWTDVCHASRVALLDTLWRSRGTLKHASLALFLEEDLDSEVDSDEDAEATTLATHTGPLVDSEGHSALQVLASLQHLECLDVDASSNYPYAGELKSGLPRLQCLTVNQGSFAEGVLPEALLLDLVRGATSLQSLTLGSDYGRPAEPFLEMVGAGQDWREAVSPALLQCVSQCSGLRHLSGPDEMAAVVASLPLLEALAVDVYPKTEGDDVAAILAGVLGECAASCSPLKSVCISVEDVFGGRNRDTARAQWARQQRAKCDRLVEQFQASRPGVAAAFYWEQALEQTD